MCLGALTGPEEVCQILGGEGRGGVPKVYSRRDPDSQGSIQTLFCRVICFVAIYALLRGRITCLRQWKHRLRIAKDNNIININWIKSQIQCQTQQYRFSIDRTDFDTKMCKYNIFVAKMCKRRLFVAKMCEYGIFVAKICKYTLIDSFQGYAMVIDKSANYATLGVPASSTSTVKCCQST